MDKNLLKQKISLLLGKELIDISLESQGDLEKIKRYKESFNFKSFDTEFDNAVIIRDLHYLSWMMLEYNEGNKGEIHQSEVDRVVKRLYEKL